MLQTVEVFLLRENQRKSTQVFVLFCRSKRLLFLEDITFFQTVIDRQTYFHSKLPHTEKLNEMFYLRLHVLNFRCSKSQLISISFSTKTYDSKHRVTCRFKCLKWSFFFCKSFVIKAYGVAHLKFAKFRNPIRLDISSF